MKKNLFIYCLLFLGMNLQARELHVSVAGDDTHDGSIDMPLKTISSAANLAQPGDVILVHEGTYRERIAPPRGGISDIDRIVYQAAPGEQVWIKGSEVIQGWKKYSKDVWTVSLPDSFFKDYNPYADPIFGDWFMGQGRVHHTGEVYLNGKSLFEVETLERVQHPEPLKFAVDSVGSVYTWYCENKNGQTTLYANFQGQDPNKNLTEINVRPTCFYPEVTGIDYITVHGFNFAHAATQWAPPTAEQIGLIGTNWSKGWIIENNTVSDSKCSGITLGKDRKSGQNPWQNNRSKDGAVHYMEIVFNALEFSGWNKENIGGHIVRNNTVFNCEQAGICGAMGAAFSVITGNHIYNIWEKRQFDGYEMAGIKIHAGIDVLVSHNRVHNARIGIWLDWQSQGTRISSNLFYNNDLVDIYPEVNHGPYLIDNNLMLSDLSLLTMSDGGAFVHNLITGRCKARGDARYTPYHYPHSTKVAGVSVVAGGDDRFYNNIFLSRNLPENATLKRDDIYAGGVFGLQPYESLYRPARAGSNLFMNGAKPLAKEQNSMLNPASQPDLVVVENGNLVFIEITPDASYAQMKTQLVNTQLLGRVAIPNAIFENPDGSPLSVEQDYFGKKRNLSAPFVGPFEKLDEGKQRIRVW